MIVLVPALALHGDLKSFTVATFPYDSAFLPPDPLAQAIAAGRAKLELRTERVDADVHHEVYAVVGGATPFTTSTGVGGTAPEAVELSWEAVDADGFTLAGRTDRLVATLHLPRVDVALGRQPVTFGAGLFFTPMDLVAPFSPTTIDQEYKPGVDAVRVDLFAGTAGRVTAVGAYHGDWALDGVVLALHAQGTVGLTDLRGLLAEVHEDEVLGAGATTTIGAVGLHGDATVTLPPEGEPFVRAVAGAVGRPTEGLVLAGEASVQTLGGATPADYLVTALDPRFARGELWALGRYYAAASASYELTPLVAPSLAAIVNLADPSVLLAPALQASVADEAVAGAGAVIGVGRRPSSTTLGSEFGTYPVSVFTRLSAYF